MNAVPILLGAILIAAILIDAFETIILPRGFSHRIRLVSAFYRVSWALWSGAARRLRSESARETLLSYYGPLSLILLLVIWGTCLILGFALVLWGVEGRRMGFGTELYMSGTTFFTLGLGDITPVTSEGRFMAVTESGVGFGFLALVISYLPILYQAFSRREVAISLLDARAGSPPTASELLIRHGADDGGAALNQLLRDWEQWSAELLESHISFPVLCYYRSQHDRQSWLASLTAILDSCALVMSGIENVPARQAQLTFAIARHAVVDLAAIFNCAPVRRAESRLTSEGFAQLQAGLNDAGIRFRNSSDAEAGLSQLRAQYEPYVDALAGRMAFTVPSFVPAGPRHDAWQTSAWHDGAHL